MGWFLAGMFFGGVVGVFGVALLMAPRAVRWDPDNCYTCTFFLESAENQQQEFLLVNKHETEEKPREVTATRWKATGRFLATCPYHPEITPSLVIDQPTRTFACYGCGASGVARTVHCDKHYSKEVN